MDKSLDCMCRGEKHFVPIQLCTPDDVNVYRESIHESINLSHESYCS